jgi:8-oxo-dGTP pyrophosphatase MutT (NUDIX family)
MSEKNPWKTLSTRKVYENPWICVREDEVIRPDGTHGIYGVIDTKIATGVVAVTPQNEVYLIGQYRYTVQEYSWEIVEGGAEPGEEALSCAKRELAEEAGLVAEYWEPLGEEVHVSNCCSSERCYLFLAKGLTSVPTRPDPTEILQIKKLPIAECLKLVDSGVIKDALSIIGLLRFSRI